MEEEGFEIVINDTPVWITNKRAIALCPDAAKRILNAAHAIFSAIERGAIQDAIGVARQQLIHRPKQVLTTLTAELGEMSQALVATALRRSQ